MRLFKEFMSKIKNHEHDGENPRAIFNGYDDTYIRLSKDRTIFIVEDITKEVASQLSALLLYFDNKNNELPIKIYLDSRGGDASGLANIYDIMQLIKSPIKTICTSKCYSAAAVILAAGAKGERYAFKHSQIMIHGIQCAFPFPGHDITSSKNYYSFLKENNDNIMKILAKHTNHTLEKVKQDCVGDIWMDPKEALEYGIIDHILT